MSLLEVKDLESGYGRLTILHGVSLHVEPGEAVAIVGPNGAGKTTLLHSIAGILPANSGSISFEGTELTKMSAPDRMSRGIGYTLQRGNIFPALTVAEHLELANTFLPRREGAIDEIFSLYPMLKERASQQANTLSGGERQMLAIGTAMVANPKLLLLDEPTAGLAPKLVADLVESVVRLKESGHAILWVVETNPLSVIRRVERVYLMEGGTVRGEYDAKSIIDDPNFIAIFMGTQATAPSKTPGKTPGKKMSPTQGGV